MKRFQFGPERIRVWRSKQAELEQLKLQQLRSELLRLEDRKQELQAEARKSAQALRDSPTINSEDLSNLDTFAQYVRDRSLNLDKQKAQYDGKIARQQRVLLEARRAAELLDRLKAASLAEWRLSYQREEDSLNNELFLARRKNPL